MEDRGDPQMGGRIRAQLLIPSPFKSSLALRAPCRAQVSFPRLQSLALERHFGKS